MRADLLSWPSNTFKSRSPKAPAEKARRRISRKIGVTEPECRAFAAERLSAGAHRCACILGGMPILGRTGGVHRWRLLLYAS